ncbi:B12-binding domain-containing radical SAM protein [Pinisolibacter aquiterrae]|uniref:B12-binding domain-containing radical SAM protein n=1 Tax=Pinisolibacter aquiterrae TaxID=2815579 RepID=UPI001C3E2203|nr:radical SAM protein [Pinisolibacter aquiterrae]MBV5263199.1 radical SAM protein [Pinisolibacter aquiterrae]MCC8234113.1 radical SAM protein [Pinisolibacter aquiterrae]
MTRYDIHLIKPTRYDDDGYPLQWYRSLIPSNSLACVAGLVHDAIAREALGANVEPHVHIVDETHTMVDPDRMIARHRQGGGRTVVFLVGVQSNQFPRAVDIARPLRAAGIPVAIGGFHVSGCVSMLDEMPADLKEAQALGISFFTGEAEEGRIDEVLRDGFDDALKPIYDHLPDAPGLAGQPTPFLEADEIRRNISAYASLDLGRGCPFECSFCSIINVQGRKSRFRTPDDLEKIVRENAANGISRFFLTDDNFARNKNWEAFVDRLLLLRKQGLRVRMAVQVDAQAHKTPRFIEKLCAVGADQIFIGLENINPDNLESVKKRQNKIEDYRKTILAWKRYSVVIICGYIVGFPNDTRESIGRDIETLKRELAIDMIYLNYLTPLPGSEDHQRLTRQGVWMDPDMNRYDLSHRVTHHPVMSDAEWEGAYTDAHRAFYDWSHMRTIIRRMVAMKSTKRYTTLIRLVLYREAVRLESVAALEAGYGRIRRRRQRRPGLPLENPLVFYTRHWWRFVRSGATALVTYGRLYRFMVKTQRDPKRFDYVDDAIRPISEDNPEALIAATRATPISLKRQQRAAAAHADHHPPTEAASGTR